MERTNDNRSRHQQVLASPLTTPTATSTTSHRKQLSSFLLFLSAVVLVNLCPFQSDLSPSSSDLQRPLALDNRHLEPAALSGHLSTCLQFVQLMFTNPMRLNKRVTRVTLAEAKVLGKMAKVWYIKKKIKKLGKKLKKHTIAVPVFTTIPIYEHYQPHHTGGHHSAEGHHYAAAASAFVPQAILAPSSSSSSSLVATTGSQTTSQTTGGGGLATAASNQHPSASYQRPPPAHLASFHQHHHQMPPAASAAHHQIINAYAPSPPLFVDEAGGLYGTYGNAYGRYDGGYQYW